MRTTILAAALSLAIAIPAAAQQPVKVSFEDGGRVTVEANGATVRAILNEWSNKGGTKVVGADRITGAPVTLKLVSVPEAQALEAILRSVAGYMAAPRPVASGPSIYDRIMIMATTTAPAPAARPQQPAANNNGAFNGTQRFIPPRVRDEQREADEQAEPDENPPNPPVFTFPQPGQQNGVNPGVNQPGVFTNTPGANQPNVVVNPATPTPAPPFQPGAPYGVSTPGMMVNPPQQQPGAPGTVPPNMIRRPGGGQ
jgi:hypothetical protein